MSCPVSPDELSAYVDGEVGEGSGARIRQHLQHCARCAQIVASFELISTTLRRQPQVRMQRFVVADVCRAVAAQHEQRPLPCHKALPMASALLDGELSRADAARVRAHLSTCAECQAEFALMRSCVTALGEREPVRPPVTLRPRILQAVAHMPAPARRAIPRVPTWRTVAALSSAAAVAAALLLAGFNVLRGPGESDDLARPPVAAEHPVPAMPSSVEVASADSEATPAAWASEQSPETTPSPTDEAPTAPSPPPRRVAKPVLAKSAPRVGHLVADLTIIRTEDVRDDYENRASDPILLRELSVEEPDQPASTWVVMRPPGEAGYGPPPPESDTGAT